MWGNGVEKWWGGEVVSQSGSNVRDLWAVFSDNFHWHKSNCGFQGIVFCLTKSAHRGIVLGIVHWSEWHSSLVLGANCICIHAELVLSNQNSDNKNLSELQLPSYISSSVMIQQIQEGRSSRAILMVTFMFFSCQLLLSKCQFMLILKSKMCTTWYEPKSS